MAKTTLSMKNRYTFDCSKRFVRTPLLLLFLLCSVIASAQQVVVTLTEAGTLHEKIGEDQKDTITSLKVSGPINGTDVKYLRHMSLVDLDLTDANIVEGGDSYYENITRREYYYTENNVIGKLMFWDFSMKSIKLPNSATRIGDDAFVLCSVKSVNIGNSVTSIGNSAFQQCYELASITIPNSVISIGKQAFEDCKNIASATIGNSVISIGNCAFLGCSRITSITIPNSVISIGDEAFEGCRLISVTFGNSVKTIGMYAFDGCSRLTSIVLPNTVTSIGGFAFGECINIKSLTLGNSVKGIGPGAFYKCSSLTSIDIPNSVIGIGGGAFSGCKKLTSVVIPDSVTSIDSETFRECTCLKSVTIGKSVKSLGRSAFYKCTAIKNLTVLSTTPPTCETYALEGVSRRYCTLYVPENSLSAYKSAYVWNEFFNIESVESTDINYVQSDAANTIAKRYDINGRQINKPTKGLNIIKMSDGTTKKVMVK